MADDEQALVRAATAGDATAVRTLVDRLAPIIQVRVARALTRWGGASVGRRIEQEVEDLTQDVFEALFADGGRVLSSWNPGRGLSLSNFVGLVAQRQVSSIMRSGRTSPWSGEPQDIEVMDRLPTAALGPESAVASREELGLLLDRVRNALSPRGLELFYRLIVHEEPIAQIAAATGMTADALYAWRSRLGRLVRSLASEAPNGHAATLDEPLSDLPMPQRMPRGDAST